MSDLAGFPLNGCDAFMLAMDHGMIRDGTSRNICHLLITLTPQAKISSIVGQLQNNPTFVAVSRLRLFVRLLRTPRWRASTSLAATPNITSHDSCVTEEDLNALVISHVFDPRHDAPFGVIALPHLAAGPSLLFYWHHALCDAHGGEALVNRIISPQESSAGSLTPSKPLSVPRREAVRRAQKTKRLIFSKASPEISRLVPSSKAKSAHRYARVSFTEAESARIDQGSRKLTGGMFPTALFLAATARAIASIPDSSQFARTPMLVPVPHDMRRSSRQKSPLSNQVSVAFFKIAPNQHATLLEVTNDVIEQLHDTIAGDHHHGMLDFFRLIRRLPSALLWRVIEYPTKGHPASFYFSDIGASLGTLSTVLGEPVAHAAHYPPNVAPPGFTAVWSRYRGSIGVTLCYDESRLSQAAIESFIMRLRADLLEAGQ
jgi:hypothetical protein